MSKNYTPPPKFKGSNADRGYTEEKPKQQESPPLSSQFPVKEDHQVVDTTNAWWNK